MKLKFSATLAMLAFAMAFTLSSCNDYEEGPAISLRSKSARIANTWKVDYAVEEDGDNNTADYEGDLYTFADDGGAVLTGTTAGTSFSGTGSWDLTNDDANFRLQLSYTAFGITVDSDDTFEILKLANDEFWIKDTDDEKIEIHLVSAND